MNTSNEIIRKNLLIQLEAAYPISLPAETLQQGLHIARISVPYHILIKELEYLLEKGFLSTTLNELYPKNRRYKLSTKGIDFLDNENTIHRF